MARVLQSLKILCLGAGTFALVAIGLSALRIEREASDLVREARQTLAVVSDYSQEQIARLRDPKQQKAIDAAIQTAAVFNGTGRLINTQVVPRAMKVLDELAGVAGGLRSLTSTVEVTIREDLATEASGTLRQTTATLAQLERSLSEAQGGVRTATDDIHRLLADPSLSATLAQTAKAAENLAAMSADGAEISRQAAGAAKQMPSIAESLEKIAKTSSKYQKPLLIVQILSVIARAFFF